MTNEEKAIQISDKFKEEHIEAFIHTAVLEMAEYKDKQFKEYLENKKVKKTELRSKMYLSDVELGAIEGRQFILDEIINELFPKEENDCSDNDE